MVRLLLLLLLVWRLARVAALVVAGWIGWELMPESARAPVHASVVAPAAGWLQSTGSTVGGWVDKQAPWLVEAVIGRDAIRAPQTPPAIERRSVAPGIDSMQPEFRRAGSPGRTEVRSPEVGDVLRSERQRFVDIMRQPADANFPR